MARRKTQEEFIADCKEVWGDRFDYSESIYVNNSKKLKIRCKEHNIVFWQSPCNHLYGKNGCKDCTAESRRQAFFDGAEKFKERGNKKHNNFFIYPDNMEYINCDTPVTIICPKEGHGAFDQTPYTHLRSKYCCPICKYEAIGQSNSSNLKDFLNSVPLEKRKQFDYSNSIYNGLKAEMEVKCKDHGEFSVTPLDHRRYLSGGCKDCFSELDRTKYSLEDFLETISFEKRKRFDYSSSEFKGVMKEMTLICNEHGEFTIPEARIHERSEYGGCPDCFDIVRSNSTYSYSYSSWEEASKTSRDFDSFKLYILKIIDTDGTIFYKIGRTFRKVAYRFHSNESMPYNSYEIVHIDISDDYRNICELEVLFHNKCKDYRYTPLLKFPGMCECFSSIDPILPYLE